MTIQELIDRNEYPPMTEMLKRVNALVTACKRIRDRPFPGAEFCGDVGHRRIDYNNNLMKESLSDMEKNGDI